MTDSLQKNTRHCALAIFLFLSCQFLAASAPASAFEVEYEPIFDPWVCEENHPEYDSGPGRLLPDNPMYDFANHIEARINDAVMLSNNGQKTLQEVLGDLAWASLSLLPDVEPPEDEELSNKIASDHFFINDVVFANPGDGIQLPANISYPRGNPPVNGFPVIIVPPGWATNELMAPGRGSGFPSDYVIVRYTPRGFANLRNGSLLGNGSSYRTGWIDMVGCKDMSDIEAIIETVGNEEFQAELAAKINKLLTTDVPPVELDINGDNVGMMGISYGSLLSLKALSVLGDKVKVAAALDGGIDFQTSFYEGNTPNWFVVTGLYAAGLLTGNAPPYMTRLFRTCMSAPFDPFYSSAEIEDWDFLELVNSTHSPGAYVDLLNASNKPLYIGALWDDQMFKPGQHFEYFSELNVDQKKMGVANGSHGYVSSTIWSEVKDFMDYHLLGRIDNGAMQAQMTMAVSNAEDRDGEQIVEHYETWPSDRIQNQRLYLKGRSKMAELPLVGAFGRLQPKKYHPHQPSTDQFGTLAGPNLLTEAFGPSTGLPNDLRNNVDVSQIIDGACSFSPLTGFLGNKIDLCKTASFFGDSFDELLGMGQAPIVDRNLYLTSVLPLIKENSIIWATSAAAQEVKIRGRSSLRLYAKSNKGYATYVAYLYDLDPKTGDAEFITHGVYTVEQGAGIYQEVQINLQPIAWNLPAGHKLALAVDGSDPQYLNRQRGSYLATVQYDMNHDSFIDIPIENANGKDIWDGEEESFLQQLARVAKAKVEELRSSAEKAKREAALAAKRAAAEAATRAEARAKSLAKKIKRRFKRR